MVTRWPRKLTPADSFTHDGYRFEAYANMERSGPWTGYVTVRSVDRPTRVLHRWMVKGEHPTLEDFIAAARTTVGEQLATGDSSARSVTTSVQPRDRGGPRHDEEQW